MSLPFFIARRYLFSKKKHNAINIISGISVCGVALATLALVCTLSVFNGFQDMVAGFFTAFDPELKITVRGGKVFDPHEACIRQVHALSEIDVWTETLEGGVHPGVRGDLRPGPRRGGRAGVRRSPSRAGGQCAEAVYG